MKTNVPRSYWFISTLALLWNALGCLAYLSMQLMPQGALEAMPEAERALFESTPEWVTSAFAISVWFGLLGCIFLLLRKSLAHPILIVSFIGIVTQQIWNFFIGKTYEVFPPEQALMPILVVLIGIYLIYYSKRAKTNNWIN